MNRARRVLAAVIAISAGLVLGATAARGQELFPRPAELEPQVAFWTRVYTEVTTKEGFIHDDLLMNKVVYQTIKVGDDLSSRERRRRVERGVQTYRDIVTKL